MDKLILAAGREKSIHRRHPWIFSGAIGRLEGTPELGETVAVRSSSGELLAYAGYSPHSQIRARVWSFDPAEVIDETFFRRRMERAIASRRMLQATSQITSNALRLVHAESDGLPGFILDQYDEVLVMQVLSAGAEYWRDTLSRLALELTGAACLYERSDVDARRLEGLPGRVGLAAGAEPPERIRINEGDLRLWVDVRSGHKTGYYLDQRANRRRVMALASGREMLDGFSYTGGFAISALLGGAESAILVDSSAGALAAARANLDLNSVASTRWQGMEADVFKALRSFRDARRVFDLIVLDPPKFAQTAAQAERAARAYKDINLLAFKLLRPGGLLVTFSCSGGVSDELFQKIVAGAALDAGVDAQIRERLHQGPDHPVALNFPEGAYLKGLICSV